MDRESEKKKRDTGFERVNAFEGNMIFHRKRDRRGGRGWRWTQK